MVSVLVLATAAPMGNCPSRRQEGGDSLLVEDIDSDSEFEVINPPTVCCSDSSTQTTDLLIWIPEAQDLPWPALQEKEEESQLVSP